MRTKRLLLGSALVIGGFALRTWANDIEPGKEFYNVIYAPKPIVLDGTLAEWSGVPVLADPKFAVPKYSGTNASPNYVLFEEYAGGTWTGPDDQTSAVQIVYDNDNVYFGFVVTDDYHENSARSAWNGDSIQLMIASADRTSQIALYNYALGGIETDADLNNPANIIVNHEAGPAADSACNCATEAVITRNTTTHKTTYEIKLPKAALGLTTLKGGPSFGLGMAINDGDGGAGQAGQKGWGGLGAHSIVFGKTPSETALITLTKGNDIEPGKEYYTALKITNSVTIDGKLTEWSGAPVLADPKFAVPKYSGTNDSPNYVLFEEYAGGTWTGPDDQTSAVQVVYDADNVYFGFVVTDDYHENSANSAWNGDSVQLMVASADRTSQIALYNYALGGIEGALGDVIVNHEAGPAADSACNCPTTANITRDAVNKKTIYEIQLPAASLGFTPPLAKGLQFGLGMAINDGDNVAGQAGQKGWGGLGAHSIVFGKTPSETAQVTLGSTVSGGDSFFLSSIKPSYNSFTFRANDKGASIVDPNSAKLTVDGQVLPLTHGAKNGDATDFAYHATTPFAPNSSHTYVIEVKDTLGNAVTSSDSFKTPNYNLDKLHSYYAEIEGSATLTADKGGHTGQAGDAALDLGLSAGTPASALVPDASFLNPTASNDVMTVSLWVKRYDFDVNSAAFWMEAPSVTSPSTLGFQAATPQSDETVVMDVGGNVVDDSEISAGIASFPAYVDSSFWTKWHHFVFVKNVAIKQIWIDGQLFLEGTSSTTPIPTDFSRIWLGAGNGGGQGGTVLNMHGLLDDFAVFGTALSQANVQSLFSGTLPSALPASTKPLAYWDFAPTVIVTPTSPTLTITRSGNAITISWPSTATGYKLRSAPAVTGPFSDVPGVTGNSYTITNPTGAAYYRLQQ